MKTLLIPCYFPSISQYVAMVQASEIHFEVEDHFQKQTNRNRMYIYSPNGKQLLNVPVKHHSEKIHQKTKDIQIEYAFDWQKQHFKSLEAAYRSSPFFEFFEDDIQSIFQKKPTYLLDLNLEIFELLNNCLSIKLNYSPTTEYFHIPKDLIDLRGLANGKKDLTQLAPYSQVFQDKHNFINNLSVLDLLFNEGRYALDYLKKQNYPTLL